MVEGHEPGWLQVAGVREVHDLHVWGLKPGVPLLAAHLVIRPSAKCQGVLEAATKACEGMGISHSTLQVRAAADPTTALRWAQATVSAGSLAASGAGRPCHALVCWTKQAPCRADAADATELAGCWTRP